MAARVNITIKNLPQIRAAFSLAPHVMTKNLNIAIRRVVLGIEKTSMENTPVDTGTLRSSHYDKFTNLRGEVGTNTEYDVFVHEGTKFMPARPFLSDAVDTNADMVDREFKDAVQNTLEHIARIA